MGMRCLLLILFIWSSANGQPVGKRFPSEPATNAFCNTASITNAIQRGSLYCTAIDLKRNSLWSSVSALYPMVGGTSASCSYNLKNTSQFQITWVGSPTFSSTGVDFNGTSQYGNTNFNLNTNLSSTSAGIAFYSRENVTQANALLFGATDGGFTTLVQINIDAANGIIGDIGSVASFTPASRAGLFDVTRISSSDLKVYRNGSQVATDGTTISLALPSVNLYIAARDNSGVATLFATNECASFIIHTGLTSTQEAILSTIINNAQTILGRNVY